MEYFPCCFLLTRTSEEGLPLFKKRWFSFLPCWFLEQPTDYKNGKAFCFRVLKISGHIWVKCIVETIKTECIVEKIKTKCIVEKIKKCIHEKSKTKCIVEKIKTKCNVEKNQD